LAHSGSGVVLFSKIKFLLLLLKFEFINPTRSDSGWIWTVGIQYIPITDDPLVL